MTQEDKELLFKDLCARLPYEVMVDVDFYYTTKELSCDLLQDFITDEKSVRPYLRPISSMTDEEKGELKLEQEKDEELFIQVINKSQNGDDSLLGTVIPHCAEDWANKNHFDYRGLIEKGLALEAPEGMYNIKEK
jgi:hypothetical protein